MDMKKIKQYSILTAMGLGMVLCVAFILWLVQQFLWACYAIGLPM